jgi:hypothetical protein
MYLVNLSSRYVANHTLVILFSDSESCRIVDIHNYIFDFYTKTHCISNQFCNSKNLKINYNEN